MIVDPDPSRQADEPMPPAEDAPGHNTSSSSSMFASQHQDYIYALALDTYGRRMATCGGDRTVRVWDLMEDGGWVQKSSPVVPAHKSAVTCVAWSHPEYGSLLATTGADSDCKIWEERSVVVNQQYHGGNLPTNSTNTPTNSIGMNHGPTALASYNLAMNAATTGSGSSGGLGVVPLNQQQQQQHGSRWTLKATLSDARKALTCVAFAPRHLGLKILVGGADGCVRVYEAIDIMNLAQWILTATLTVYSNTTAAASSGPTAPPAAATSRSQSTWGVVSVSWCTGRFEQPSFVVGGAQHLAIYRYSDAARSWLAVATLPSTYDVLDVAWCPNVGRRYHYIAAAQGETLTIYKLRRPDEHDAATASSSSLSVLSTQVITTNAWRCQWNVTGTVLASSGDGGLVRLWKVHPGTKQDFQCVSQIRHGNPATMVT
jgi:nucleoporin SEH1